MFASEWFSMCGSRAHSYVSMKSDWSMGQPYDFKGDVPYPHSSWIQKDSSDCPSPSLSMKSDKSMDRLFNFKTPIRSPELRIQKESSDCPFQSCLSMKSDESMDPPMSFKSQIRSPELSEFSSSLLTADHVRCSVCSSILRDPVSIPCGHSYCKHCINTYWSQPGPAGDYVCLQCEKSYPVRPELSINVALNWMLQAHQQTVCSPVCPTLPQAAPGHVACDVCSSLTRRAIKTCLTCSASYCENHLAHHYTVPALQKHTLVQINEDTRLIDLRMEIKEERIVDSECGEHLEISGKRTKKRRKKMHSEL